MISFEAFYSIDDFTHYTKMVSAYSANHGDKSDEQQARVDCWLDTLYTMEAAIYSFLCAKALAGELSAIQFVEGRKLRWPDAWNRLVAGKQTEYDSKTITSGMCLMAMLDFGIVRTPQPADVIQACYERMIISVNDGAHIEPSSAYWPCDLTAETIHMQMTSGWQPVCGSYSMIHTFVPLSKNEEMNVISVVTSNAPSGELLINDWFRFDAFTKTVESKDYISIETHHGIAQKAEHYARNYNFMSVFTGNEGHRLIEREGQLILTSNTYNTSDLGDDEEPGFVGLSIDHGFLNSDLWWATVIDRQVLIDIAASSVGKVNAELLIESHLTELGGDVNRIHVPKGSTIYGYHMSGKNILEHKQCSDVNTLGMDHLYAVVSLKQLTWEPIAK